MTLKKKIGGALLATALGASLIGGGTFALFTSSATNAGNTFTAGDLVLTDLTNGVAMTQTQFAANMAPGDSETATVTVSNDGSLDAWVRIDQAASSATHTGTIFGGVTPLTITYDADVVHVPAGGQTTFDVTYSLPLAAGNTYQNATGQFDIVVQAVQVRNNTTDANGNGNLTDEAGPDAWN